MTTTETPATDPMLQTKTASMTTGPETYEDCLELIGSLDSEGSVDNLKAGIRKLTTFFQKRIKKKGNERQRDGSEAVKKAMRQGRTFKKFEPPTTASTPTQGLFS